MLRRIIKGIRREKGDAPRDTRLPLTPLVLQKLFAFIGNPRVNITARMVRAAFATATLGLLRCCEFASGSRCTPGLPLRYRSFAPVCAVRELVSLTLQRFPHGVIPLSAFVFVDDTGAPLSRSVVINEVKRLAKLAGLSSYRFTGHSFRQGGATSLAAAGVSPGNNHSGGEVEK